MLHGRPFASPSRLHAFVALAATVVASLGCDGCKKAQETTDKVKKEVVAKLRSVDEAPPPANLVAELVVKDAEAFVKKSADGAGFSAEVGPSPFEKLVASVPDENAKKGLRSIDPHGPLAVVATMVFAPDQKPHVILAAKLKDPEIATVALTAAAKGGQIKSWDSKVLDTQVYEPGAKGEIAVYGEWVVVSDTREAIESGGKYAAWKASKGASATRDLSLRVPMDKVGPELQKVGNAGYASIPAGTIPPKLQAALDPMIGPVLQGIADMGELTFDVDTDGKTLRFDEKVGAKGSFATWLGHYPVGDAKGLLSMPKADGGSLSRFPDGLGPLIYAGADTGLSASGLKPADRADVQTALETLGKSLGHEWALANKGGGASSEFLLRVELSDPAGAKKALPALEKAALKSLPTKGAGAPKLTPYKKLGAEGDEVSIETGPGATIHLLWAVRGSYLFVAYANAPWSIVDAAIDPASTATFEKDAAASAKIATYPSKNLASASYGDTWSFSKSLVPGAGASAAPAAGTGTQWSWSTVDSSGLVAKGEIPLAFIGDLTRFYMGLFSMFGPGAAPPPY